MSQEEKRYNFAPYLRERTVKNYRDLCRDQNDEEPTRSPSPSKSAYSSSFSPSTSSPTSSEAYSSSFSSSMSSTTSSGTRPRRAKILQFEDFLGEKNAKQEDFWLQRGVKQRLGPLRAEIEALETAACNNNGDVSKIPDDVFVIADDLGVSPEMILDYFGKDVLFARKLNRDQQQLTPAGTIISRKPKLDEYLEGKCGTKSDFWQQAYVEKLVKEAQEAKIGREEAANQLGVTVKVLKTQIEKRNQKDEFSEYERLRQENIAERMQLFKQLAFQDLKDDVKILPKPKPPKEILRLRPKSVRIQKKKLNKLEKDLKKAYKYHVPNVLGVEFQLRQILKMMQNREEKEKDLENIAEIVKIKTPVFKGNNNLDLHYTEMQTRVSTGYGRGFGHLMTTKVGLDLTAVAQLTDGLIQCCDAFPNQFLVAAGDDQGEIGLWLGHERTIRFKPHASSINALTFDPWTPSTLFMSTDDGYVKKVDLNKKSFTSIYSKEDRINWHQHWDHHTLLVGHDSYVDRMDLRDGKGWRNFINVTNGSKIALEKNNNVGALLTRDRKLCLFDMRCLKNNDEPLSYISLHQEGSRVLFNCDDNLLAVSGFDLIEEVDDKVRIFSVKNRSEISYVRDFYDSKDFSDRFVWHPSKSRTLFMPTPTSSNLTMSVSAMNIHSDLAMAEFPLFSNQDLSLYTFNDNQPFIAVCDGFAQGSVSLMARVDYQIPNY